jgi:hypothetical protein|tara:strand:- start:15177 stop:15515 length:339 start_codon:yes stop_codon:yes gene_type:complete
MQENKDYELIPSSSDSHAWHIRILTGDFVETVVQYGTVAFDGKRKQFTYDFSIIESPDLNLTVDNEDLHFVLARVLEDIIERGEKDGWVKLEEKKRIDEYENRTDDTSKIIN